MFERIAIRSGYQSQTNRLAVGVAVQVSLVPGVTAVKGICTNAHVGGLPFEDNSGWSTFADRDDQEFWERVSPGLLLETMSKYSLTACHALLEHTTAERKLFNECRTLAAKGNEAIDQEFGKLLPEEICRTIDRIEESPVVLLPDVSAYKKSAFLIVTVMLQRGQSLKGFDPYENRLVFSVLQMLASYIHQEPGWSD